MKTNIIIIFSCLILCGCITEFEPNYRDEVAGILVVDGIITDDESVITLSRSKGLSFEDNIFDLSPYHVTDAKVYIECDDGTQWGVTSQNSGEYTIVTEKLNRARQYRLKIEFESHEYCSEFAYPMDPPEIDLYWTKKDKGQPVNIHLETNASDNAAHYYRWSYREDWEFRAKVPMAGYPYLCSKHYHSKGLMLGTDEKNSSGQTIKILTEISPSDDRLAVLYRIDATQHAITKRAFDYYTNITKNARNSGSIFAQHPSELKGNITCVTDPARIAIGFVDISSNTRGRLYIYRDEDVYEQDYIVSICYKPYQSGAYYPGSVLIGGSYIELFCIDCRLNGGRPINELPDDWPNQYPIEDYD